MKENKTIRSIAFALGFFVLWGNIISLMLPADQYGTVIKTVDFVSVLFVLAILAAFLAEAVKAIKSKDKDNKQERGGNQT